MSTLLSQKLVATFQPTHVHAEGEEYEVLDFPRVKCLDVDRTTVTTLAAPTWQNGVLYRNKDNELCVRTAADFNDRFKPL